MKNLKKITRRAICVLLTMAMLCADSGVTVYATAGSEQEILEEAVKETLAGKTQAEEDMQAKELSVDNGQIEDSTTGEMQAEDGKAEESSKDNERTEGDLAEEGETGEPFSEEMPVKEENTDENSDGENAEAGVTEENPVMEDGTVDENDDVEDVEDTGDASAEESMLENDIEDAEENLETATKTSGGNIASGEYKENGNDITWMIDAYGKLTVEGTGDFAGNSHSAARAPWYDNGEFIQYAEINVTSMTDASFMFNGCKNLTSVDLDNFNTSNVTNMRGMFTGCSSLTSVDLSGCNTSQVTDMSSMFMGCDKLSELDLSNFDTSQVTDMWYMFCGCSNLTSLDLSKLDTSQVRDMRWMFDGCINLINLDMSNFDTSQVTDMGWMFHGCSSLKDLDLSNFDTSQVTDMTCMFSGCSSLKDLDLSNFNTSQVTSMSHMFATDGSNLINLDVDNFDTSQVKDMRWMFYGCSGLTKLDVSNFDTSQVKNMEYMFTACGSLIDLDVSNFDTGQVTNMEAMFLWCGGLTNLNVSNFDTSQVTGMGRMFEGCSSLTNLNVSNFDTSQVADMSSMFWGCELTSLDLSNFNTSQVTYMSNMFCECTKLTSLNVSNFDTGQVRDMSSMFWGCEFTSLDLSNFNTSQVTNMSYMFNKCSNLTSLALGNFNTSQVTNMSGMFLNCSSLKSVDMSNFDVSQVTDALRMFPEGNNELLTIRTPYNLKLSVALPSGTWYQTDGTQITELPQNLEHSILIKKDEIPIFSVLEATKTKIRYMCGDTVSIDDLTVLYYDADGMTHNLEKNDYTTNADEIDMSTAGKKTLIITYHDDGNVFTDEIELTVTPENIIAMGEYKENDNNITWAIDTDGKLTVEGTGDFAEPTVADEDENEEDYYYRAPWYDYRMSIISAEINVTDMTDASCMFYDCNNLVDIDLSGFDTKDVTNMAGMFLYCSSLTNIDLSGINTENVTSMRLMFYGCDNLLSLDLSAFNTINVKDMTAMFTYCYNLIDLNVSGFNTTNVTTMRMMFEDCNSLINLDVSNFNTANVTDMSDMFEGCCELTYLDVSNFNTRNVTDMSWMFFGCAELIYLDLSNFDTRNVTDMLYMFDNCIGLTSLNLSNFDTTNVTDMSGMFDDCKGLINLNLNSFDTTNVTDMSRMFRNCSGLANLDLSNFDVSNVTRDIDICDMVDGCNGLNTIHTPYNLKHSVPLPKESAENIWYQADGTAITELPQNLEHSILIKKNEIPLVPALRIVKAKTNYTCGEAINLDDLTVTYYDANSIVHKLGNNDYTTSANEIDMSIPGKKTLVIIYNDGKNILTEEIELTVTGKQPDEPPVISVDSIVIDRTVLSLKVGETATLTATVTPDNAADKTVTWVSSDGTVAEVEDGVVEAITAGECTITASAGGKSAICNVTVEYGANGLTVAVPVATPESGRQLTAGSKVTLTCETAKAEIYYTTGNSEKALTNPTEKSTHYAEPITINKDMYIKAVAKKGDSWSKTVTLHYTVVDASDRVLKPYAVPGQGAVEKGTKVELKSDTSDAAIYYVTGQNANMLGAVPVDDTHKYTEPIEITRDIVIKAIAKKDGMKDSDFSTFVYKIKVTLTSPAAIPASGTVERGSYISLNADSDTNIYYTMDQSNPMTSGSAKLYESKVRVDGDSGSIIVIKAVAEKNGVYSEIVTFTYTVSENTVKGLHVMLADSEEFTYTGSAITPAVIVTNNGEELTEGEDYTVRYSNNVKAADKNARKAPKITVTGKGNLTKSRSVTFSIMPKDIGDEEEIVGGNIVVVQGKTASPVLFYGSVKLTTKDFVNPNAKKKYNQDETITLTGKGNFEGTRDIDVRVVDKNDLKKFTVVMDNQALKEEPLIYDGEEKTLNGYFEVFDTADKSTPLEEYSDYVVIYPKDNINAGKVKFTVVGLGEYYGTVTKTYTIKPRVVKTDTDGNMEVNVNNGDNYAFRNGGVTISDLTVTCDGNDLIPGKDYKVTYSNNKKICTGNKAKCTISFTGNYKGSKALVRKFNITPAVLDDVDQINGSVSVAVGDMAYTGKPGAYKSIPYVTANGVLLKSADYKVSYYKDQDRKQVIDGKTASSSVNLASGDMQTVYVKIEGKGNYEGTLTATYNVYRMTEDVIDLTKAKVNFVGGNKAEYTGEGVEPKIEVMYKSGRSWKKVDANDIGTYITVTHINNVNKGKATVMVNGNGGKYVGSKTAVFSIVPKSMK